MQKKGTVLIIDDNKSILSALKLLLSQKFEKVLTLSSPNQLKTTLRENDVNVVLLDMNFNSGVNNGNEGIYWLQEIKRDYTKGLEVVLITAYADIELAIKGMKYGANDFIVKPWDNTKLLNTLQTAYENSVLSKTSLIVKQNTKSTSVDMYWGLSKKMLDLKQLVEKVAVTDANIMIIGENGTGKEVLAREIHNISARARNQMVTVDMGAITETLFESELFGHTKGAFTDAKNDRIGKFELANQSTLFLDEIANLQLHLQSKLLTVLQTRKVVKVGGNTPIDIDVRLISATNQNIEQMVDSGEFRMDLMYRMNTVTIKIPALRERKEDIIPLSNRFLELYATKYDKTISGISPTACDMLENYYWSGNIRELQHCVEKAVIMCSGTILKEEDFDLKPSLKNYDTKTKIESSDEMTLEEIEINVIKTSIDKYSGNLSMVASALGVSRQTLYNKIKKYNI